MLTIIKRTIVLNIVAILSVSTPLITLAEERLYVGVGSCSSSNCHGSVSPIKGTNILQDEYVTWQKHDLHSKAYLNLTSADGTRIAANLGIKDPTKDKLCLDCHATNAPDGQRGPNFTLEDGVGCESCHGAASTYLETHTKTSSTHSKNLSNGMADIASPSKRAALCLSCHYGTEEKSVTHRIMGAGHPRLSFELDTFSMIQPKHWLVDDDYKTRKGDYNSAKTWLIGQIANSVATLEALLSPTRSRDGMWPEFTLMYCYTCHHNLSDKQFKSREYQGKPGELKLNTSSLLIISEALSGTNNKLAENINRELKQLHLSFKSGSYTESAKALHSSLKQAMSELEQSTFTKETLTTLLKQLAAYGVKGDTLQYEVAEQIAMAMQSIVSTLDSSGTLYKVEIQAIYDTLKAPETYQPADFTTACNQLLAKL